ncbi:hypothetical protein NV379_08830 [Paenibacillus sp. N1-5-1-14]|uniref:hypothetical protein n=1 Tax=Paenibacillus radicibacter TaxID=2972488 RepID=UPI0021590CA2|nr:hypothetical protein [Paenibacillus radicibacter]MCR8642766.1 hypothetical protein [Paenibacillus radicibacter]
MLRAGIIFLILGVGAFILPQFGLQFKLFNVLEDLFGESQTLVEIGVAVLGAILVVIHFAKKNNSSAA